MGIAGRVAIARRRGFSVFEIAIVLMIVAGVIGGILYAAASSNDQNKVNDTIAAVANIRQAVREMYKEEAEYTGLSPNLLALSRMLPGNLVHGNEAAAALRSPFGGYIGVMPTADFERFAVALGGLPYDACVRLATTDMGAEVAAVYVSDGIKSAAVSQGRVLTPIEASEACGEQTGNAQVAFGGDIYPNSLIAWVFY